MTSVFKLLTDATAATTTGDANRITMKDKTIQAVVTGTGALTATVLIHVSLDGSNWVLQATISLAGNDAVTDGYATSAPWLYTRATLTAISGTNATVNVFAGA
jgi:hypothetical protein